MAFTYFLYIYHPVKIPTAMLAKMLIILIAFEPALIVSPLCARMRSLLPIKVGTRSFGDMMAVARPYMRGCTVGNVDTAPLHIEYGSGQSLIIQSSFKPSYFRVRARAAKRLSCSINRWTKDERRVRETIKEQVEPITVPIAYMSHLRMRISVSVSVSYINKGDFSTVITLRRSRTYPFQTPKINPATVPIVDQPTSGGKETVNVHIIKTK